MRELDSGSVDAVVTDPPYGIGFMGKEWDVYDQQKINAKMSQIKLPEKDVPNLRGRSVPAIQASQIVGGSYDRSLEGNSRFQAWCKSWAFECLRVLKSGGFLFSFGGTRTHHRMTAGIEDAGFVIRDELCWVYLQGFPKAQDLGMLVEKKLGGEGEVVGKPTTARQDYGNDRETFDMRGEFSLKQPTLPLAREWVGWKTPALKPAFEPIVVAQKPCEGSITENVLRHGVGGFNIDACRIPFESEEDKNSAQIGDSLVGKLTYRGNSIENRKQQRTPYIAEGRFPANVLMTEPCFGGDSKFFLIPKADKGEKNEGVDLNNHPTVKPVLLMEHLIKLCTREKAVVLDPFMGSGTTGVACWNLNREFIGIEKNEEYFKIAEARVGECLKQTRLGGG